MPPMARHMAIKSTVRPKMEAPKLPVAASHHDVALSPSKLTVPIMITAKAARPGHSGITTRARNQPRYISRPVASRPNGLMALINRL